MDMICRCSKRANNGKQPGNRRAVQSSAHVTVRQSLNEAVVFTAANFIAEPAYTHPVR